MSKELRQVEENVWVTLNNLQRYKTQSDAQLDKKITEIKERRFYRIWTKKNEITTWSY